MYTYIIHKLFYQSVIRELLIMYREELRQYIFDNYSALPDHPWAKYPDNEVFRHPNNKKWFAIIMNVPVRRLGLKGTQKIDIVNLKCDPIMIGSLRDTPGFYPAYHMNKDNWITCILDGTVNEDAIKTLLDISYDTTS